MAPSDTRTSCVTEATEETVMEIFILLGQEEDDKDKDQYRVISKHFAEAIANQEARTWEDQKPGRITKVIQIEMQIA